jgi:hypothetical protein
MMIVVLAFVATQLAAFSRAATNEALLSSDGVHVMIQTPGGKGDLSIDNEVFIKAAHATQLQFQVLCFPLSK